VVVVESKKYLIGPEIFGTYVKVLKIVLSVATSLVAIGTAIDASVNSYGFFEAFLLVLNAIFNSAIWSFGMVTLIFAFGERKGWKVSEEEPRARTAQKPFSRIGVIVGMVFIVILMAAFNGFGEILGYYSTPGATLHPLFNQQVFSGYLLYINSILAAQLLFTASKLVFREWTYLMAAANLVLNAASLALFLAVMGNPNLINTGFIAEIGKQSGEAAAGVKTALSMLRSVLYVIIPAVIIFDTAEGFWNAYRNNRNNEKGCSI
jgi:hypothetical protein